MKRSAAIAVATALAVSTLAGCSQSSKTKPAAGSTGPSVAIKLLTYTPGDISVKVGSSITWTNNDELAHTVTTGSYTVAKETGLRAEGSEKPDGVFNQEMSGAGKTATYTFAKAGTYRYYCRFHRGMNATVTVTP